MEIYRNSATSENFKKLLEEEKQRVVRVE